MFFLCFYLYFIEKYFILIVYVFNGWRWFMFINFLIFGDFINSVKGFFDVFVLLQPYAKVVAIIEIIVLTFVIYKILKWVKDTHSFVLLKGIGVIIVFALLVSYLRFEVISFILQKIWSVALILIVIIFQNDIKAMLERLGRQRVFSSLIPNLSKISNKPNEDVIDEIVKASFLMGAKKTGALIVIEKNESLLSIERTGIVVDGVVTKELLINIFEKNTPLHDGAVLIVGDKVKAATCYLPLSENINISKELGTRHRAALGISEVSDSQTVVVSEETGNVSLCANGNIKVMKDERELRCELLSAIYDTNKASNEDNVEKKVLA